MTIIFIVNYPVVIRVQLLHGSNPIGGQSALIKLRWGVFDEMKTDDRLIHKFLGENETI